MKNIYLISGNSYHLLNSKIKSIVGENPNVTTFSLTDVSINDVIEDASYFGLFEEDRIIIVKDVKYFGGKFLYEEDMDNLLKFISNMDDKLTLIFVCDAISESKENTNKMKEHQAKIVDLNATKEEDKQKLIKEFLDVNNIKIDDNTLGIILNNCNNDLDTSLLEIEKLSNVDNVITKDIVDKYGIKLTSIENFAFSNAVVAKNFNAAFRELDKLIETGVTVPEIVGMLSSQYTNMYAVRDAVSRNLSDEDIAKAFGYSSTSRVYAIKKNSKIYTMEELKDIIIRLSELDIKSKSGENPIYALKEFLISI